MISSSMWIVPLKRTGHDLRNHIQFDQQHKLGESTLGTENSAVSKADLDQTPVKLYFR